MKRCHLLIVFLLLVSLCQALDAADTPEATEQYKYALGLIQRQMYEEASVVLQRVLSDAEPFSKRDAAMYWFAECHYRLGRFNEAIGAYQKMRQEFPASTMADRAAYGLGWAHARNNDPKSAVEAFNRVTPADGKLWIDARLKMGLLMVKFNMDAETTAKVYEQLLSRKDLTDAQRFEALFQAGVLRFNQTSYQTAVGHFTDALAKAPAEQLTSVLFFLAESHFRQRAYKDASSY
ncbi:MAG TPA: tetratricopeptide repeat protein, partial [Candidatus Ozemobacteraceae bacterium]|nr:tetratricopeptide repeat protein [Candidatus Ozemobacteraceae bacterium]